MKERIGLAAFSAKEWETSDDCAERAEFVRFLSRSHLNRIRGNNSKEGDRGTPKPRLANDASRASLVILSYTADAPEPPSILDVTTNEPNPE